MHTLRIDLPLLLPELPDARDACVARLQALLSPKRGILQTHVREVDGKRELCLHYDPALISGEEVRQLARAAGADVHARVGHHLVALRAVAGEDTGRRIEQALSAIDGLLAVSVILPAERARIEFDRERVTTGAIDQAIRDLRFGAEEAAPPPAPPLSWYRRNRELVWSLERATMRTGLPVGLQVGAHS